MTGLDTNSTTVSTIPVLQTATSSIALGSPILEDVFAVNIRGVIITPRGAVITPSSIISSKPRVSVGGAVDGTPEPIDPSIL